MSAWSLMLRRARRVALRSPWRTAWTAALVVLPVAVGVVLLSATWGNHVRATSVERTFGQADAIYHADQKSHEQSATAAAALIGALPAGSRSATVVTVGNLDADTFTSDDVFSEGALTVGKAVPAPDGRRVTEVDGASAAVEIRMADWRNPVLGGVLSLVDGRAPRRGEVVLSPDVSEAIDAGIGDRVVLTDADATLDVVGIGTAGPSSDGLILDAGELVPAPPTMPVVFPTLQSTTVFVDVPEGATLPSDAIPAAFGPTWNQTFTGPVLRHADVVPRTVADDPSGDLDPAPLGALVGLLSLAVLLVGLLAGSAFGIGARRRLRANGLLAANGADRAQLTLAAAAEAVVVALPAAVLGVAGALAVPPAWVRFRLPGWSALTEAVMPWSWVALLVVAAVVASAVGAVAFSRALRSLPTSALLDSRSSASAGPVASSRIGPLASFGLGVIAYVACSTVLFVVGRGASIGSLAAVAMLVLWATCAVGALWLLRLGLGRDPIGRLVERDLRRHRLGSTAAVLIVATWVFVAVGGTATDQFSTATTKDSGASAGVDSASSAGLVPTTTFPPGGSAVPGSSAVPGAATSPAGETPVSDDTDGTGILVTTQGTSPGSSPPGDWVQRGSDGASAQAPGAPLPAGLRARLEHAGLTTTTATVGDFTGPCQVCPQGMVPTVLVLDSADGTGLAPATVELLRTGAAVTPFNVDSGQTPVVAGVPVRTGAVPPGVEAVVLASSVLGAQVANGYPVLVGDTSGLDAKQVAAVAGVLSDVGRRTGLSVMSWDARIDGGRWTAPGGSGEVSSTQDWGFWPWVLALLVITLVVTAAHRREHGEAGRVLWVLGAGPRAARRLSSLAAFSLAGIGVAMGLTAVLVVIAAEAVRPRVGDPFEGLWNREATLLLVASLVVPLVVGLFARLLPPGRADHGPDGPMPA